MNELIFVLQIITLCSSVLAALYLGKEALVAFICTCCLLANFFVVKQISLMGLSATASDAFTIGATIGLNLLQEYFGKAITRTTIMINFFILMIYGISTILHLQYIPHSLDHAHTHYTHILTPMPRILLASVTVYFIAQVADYYIFGFLKRITHTRFLVLRNYGSIAISQLIDTILFSYLGLYGIVEHIPHIIIISYTIKMCALLLSSPFVGLSRTIIPRPSS